MSKHKTNLKSPRSSSMEIEDSAVYLDHAGTTPLDPVVGEAMAPYWGQDFGNSSSSHRFGRRARIAVREAKESVAASLRCEADEILFTSGGTESNNLAIRGVVEAQNRRDHGTHFVTTAAEHHAILEPARYLHRRGFPVTILPVDAHGCVSPDLVADAVREDTALVSVIWANNEVGSINPIGKIGELLAEKGIRFHVDAVQAVGAVDLDVRANHIDLLTLSGHKIYGPKGVGILFAKRKVPIDPQITGGGQQHGFRAGTEAVPLVVGFSRALELAHAMRLRESERLSRLRDRLVETLCRLVPGCRLLGDPERRLPGHACFAFKDVSGAALVRDLDEFGIAVSESAACTSGDQEPSHVLRAMEVDPAHIAGVVRMTLGRSTRLSDIDRVLEVLPPLVAKLVTLV